MLTEKLLKRIDKKRKNYPQHCNRMSSIGWPCDRNCVYQITHWNEKIIPSIELQLIFGEGNHQEKAVMRDLEEAGITLIRQQEPMWLPEYQLSGHAEGVWLYRRVPRVIEIKSMSTHLFPKINTTEDLWNSPFPWHNCYVIQIQLYMYGTGIKRGIILIKDKNSGQLKEIPVERHKVLCEAYLGKCEVVNVRVNKIREVLKETYKIKEIANFDMSSDREDYQEIKIEACNLIEQYLPERINDEQICRNCSFNHICLPDEIREERAKVWIDTELEGQLIKRDSLLLHHSDYEALDKEIKQKIKDSGENYLICGDFEIVVTRGKTTRVNIKKTE